MKNNTRSKAPTNTPSIDEEFFKNNPTRILRQQMKQVVQYHVNNLVKTGTDIANFKDKKGFTYQIAEYLKENQIGEWAKLSLKHTRQSEYKMYKCLVDIVHYELKCRS